MAQKQKKITGWGIGGIIIGAFGLFLGPESSPLNSILILYAILSGALALKKGDIFGYFSILIVGMGTIPPLVLSSGFKKLLRYRAEVFIDSFEEALPTLLHFMGIVGLVILVVGSLLLAVLVLFCLYLPLKKSFATGFFGRPSFLQECIRGICSLGAIAGAIASVYYLGSKHEHDLSIFHLLPAFMTFPVAFFVYFLLGPSSKE